MTESGSFFKAFIIYSNFLVENFEQILKIINDIFPLFKFDVFVGPKLMKVIICTENDSSFDSWIIVYVSFSEDLFSILPRAH